MLGRTFFRKMLDKILNNVIVKTLVAFVNFCNEQRYYTRKEIKFSEKMPLTSLVEKEYYKSKFVFNSITSKRTGFK